MPHAYMLRCSDGSYYAGSTIDLDRRLWEHNHGGSLGAAYTRRRRPVVLVWSAAFDRIDDAYAAEKKIQGWGRRKREALIAGDWTALSLLSRRASVQRATTDGGD